MRPRRSVHDQGHCSVGKEIDEKGVQHMDEDIHHPEVQGSDRIKQQVQIKSEVGNFTEKQQVLKGLHLPGL